MPHAHAPCLCKSVLTLNAHPGQDVMRLLQGILAGLNAAMRAQGRAPVTLTRESSYIGTLLDDLVTKVLHTCTTRTWSQCHACDNMRQTPHAACLDSAAQASAADDGMSCCAASKSALILVTCRPEQPC